MRMERGGAIVSGADAQPMTASEASVDNATSEASHERSEDDFGRLFGGCGKFFLQKTNIGKLTKKNPAC